MPNPLSRSRRSEPEVPEASEPAPATRGARRQGGDFRARVLEIMGGTLNDQSKMDALRQLVRESG